MVKVFMLGAVYILETFHKVFEKIWTGKLF